MRENNVGRRDRSYLCLVAIYAIHAVLLNVVFVQPNLHNTRNTLSSGYVLSTSGYTNIVINSNKSMLMNKEGVHFDKVALDSTNRTNSNGYHEERKNAVTMEDDDYDDYSAETSTHGFLQQSKSGGAALRFLMAATNSRVSRLTNNAITTARSIVERLSPAAVGILSGCLVFLLTFTENDYV